LDSWSPCAYATSVPRNLAGVPFHPCLSIKESKIATDRADRETREDADVILSVGKQRHWNFQGHVKLWLDQRLQRFKEYGNSDVEPMI